MFSPGPGYPSVPLSRPTGALYRCQRFYLAPWGRCTRNPNKSGYPANHVVSGNCLTPNSLGYSVPMCKLEGDQSTRGHRFSSSPSPHFPGRKAFFLWHPERLCCVIARFVWIKKATNVSVTSQGVPYIWWDGWPIIRCLKCFLCDTGIDFSTHVQAEASAVKNRKSRKFLCIWRQRVRLPTECGWHGFIVFESFYGRINFAMEQIQGSVFSGTPPRLLPSISKPIFLIAEPRGCEIVT